MRSLLGKILFNLSWLPCRLSFRFFLRYKVKNQERLNDLEPPLIVVSNHTSFIDPYLISAAFPFNSKLFPIRFAVAPKYYKFPLFYPFIWLYGSFPVYKKIGLENSLKVPFEILKKKGVVGIFPEGKIRRRGRPRKGRRGAAYLALKTNVPILPVRIEGALNLTLKKFILRRKKVTIIVGELFYLPKNFRNSQDINKATDLIMEKLKELKL